jgi:hypothetical protein
MFLSFEASLSKSSSGIAGGIKRTDTYQYFTFSLREIAYQMKPNVV